MPVSQRARRAWRLADVRRRYPSTEAKPIRITNISIILRDNCACAKRCATCSTLKSIQLKYSQKN